MLNLKKGLSQVDESTFFARDRKNAVLLASRVTLTLRRESVSSAWFFLFVLFSYNDQPYILLLDWLNLNLYYWAGIELGVWILIIVANDFNSCLLLAFLDLICHLLER